MNYDFSKKVVLVTGGSAGIGEATALLMAKLGANLVIVGRSEETLKSVAEKIRKESGVDVLPIAADLSTDEGCEKTAKDTLDHFGRVDVLVNNAAVCGADTIQKASMAVFDSVFRTDLRSVYNLTRLLVPALVQAQGNVINITSGAGHAVNVGVLSYSMAKAALEHFTRLTALELAPKGVRVNTVSPGVTVSKFHQRMTGESDEQYGKFLQNATRAIPLGKVCAPEDIARAIAHLASEHSRLVTGTTVHVDGGLQFTSLSQALKESIK